MRYYDIYIGNVQYSYSIGLKSTLYKELNHNEIVNLALSKDLFPDKLDAGFVVKTEEITKSLYDYWYGKD